MRYEVTVPASTGNLGPGYDILGLALCKYLYVSARPANSWQVITHGFGEGELPTDGRNLIARTVTDTCADRRWPLTPLAVEVRNEIPTERGLGSSSTAIVAGVILAFLVNADHFEKDEIFEIATEFEGHPDNVAPAIYGGLRFCGGATGNWFAHPKPIHERIRLAVAVPTTPANTKTMRGLLPATYSEKDERTTREAVETLLRGLAEGDPSALIASEWDVKHQPYRFPALPESERLYRLFQKESTIVGAFLSGAGPSVAGWFFEENRARVQSLGESIGAHLEILAPDQKGAQWRTSFREGL